jgi:hypothetical protein
MVWSSSTYRGIGFLLSYSWNLVEANYHASDDVSYVLWLAKK